MRGQAAPGWYPDRTGRTLLRWWDGAQWTPWESDGVRQWYAEPGPGDGEALRFVERVLLPEARRRGLVPGEHLDALGRLAAEMAGRAAGRPVREAVEAAASGWVTPTPVPTPAPVPAPTPAPVPAPMVDASRGGAAPAEPWPGDGWSSGADGPARLTRAGYVPVAPPRAPGRVATWWSSLRARLDADLTVHGLAYLGVLLLFVGVFGLVAFAFGDVSPGMRPVAELAVAVVPFVAARVLARSGAGFVARTMVGLGGLLVGLMVVTSTVDGYGFPPDLHGPALPIGAGLACAALAAGYVGAGRRGSALGAVAAPVLWLAAAMGAAGLGRPVPAGEDVAVAGAAQVAVLALAVLATTAAARRRGGETWASGALAAALPGVVVTGVLGLVAGVAEGWPLIPVVVTLGALAGAVSVAPRTTRSAADVVLVVAWALAVLRLVTVGRTTPLLSADVAVPGWAESAVPGGLLAAVLAGVALAELLRRRAPADALGDGSGSVAFGALVGSLPLVAGLTLLESGWWAIGAGAALAAWSAVRRVHAPVLPGAAAALDVVAASAPVVLVLGVRDAAGGVAGLLAAGAATAASTVLARGRLRSPASPAFWTWWWASAVGVTALASVAVAAGPQPWPVPLVAAVLVAAVAAGPGPAAARVAVATPLVWWAWLALLVVADLPGGLPGWGLAVIGLVAVVVAHVVPGRRGVLAAVAVAGHATAVPALVLAVWDAWPFLAADAWPIAVALGAATGAWLLTAAAGERGRSPLGSVLDAAGLGPAPWALALVGVPATVSTTLHASSALPLGHAWAPTVLLAAAVAYAALTRVTALPRLRAVLPWAAFAASLLGVVTARHAWVLVAALGVVVVQVVLTRGRHVVMVWAAWVAVTPAVALAARTGLASVERLPGDVVVAGSGIGIGGLLLVGAFVADRARPDDPRALPRRRTALPPAVVGGAHVLLGLLVAVTVRDDVALGVLVLGTAVVLGVVAGLGGAGVVGATALLLGWAGAGPLLGDAHPGAWAHVAVAAVLAGVAQLASRSGRTRPRWARWDVPLVLAAVLPALTALATAPDGTRPFVFLVVGALVVVAAARLAHRRGLSEVLGWIGTGLVLTSAGESGPGWTALALLVLAAAHTALAAVRETGLARTARQWVGALAGVAAWVALLRWVDWTPQVATDVTAVAAAAAVLAGVGTVAALGRGRSWLVPWGTSALLLVAGAVGSVVTGPGGPGAADHGDVPLDAGAVAGWWLVGAGVLLAAAAVLAERALPWGWWREVGAGLVLAAVLTAFVPGDASAVARVSVLAVLAVVSAAVLVVLARIVRVRGAGASGWLRPLAVLGAASVAVAAVVPMAAASAPAVPGAGVDEPVLLLVSAVVAAAAVQAAATGVAYRVLGLRLAAPVIGWLAWAAYAADAVSGSTAWYTVPVGLAMLVVVAVWRADRRDRGLPPADPAVARLELTGVAFLVVSSFVSAFTDSVLHALAAAGIGVAVALWGVVTRVRRRFVTGAGIVVAGLVLAVALPLVALLPAVGEAGAWVAVAAVGLLAVMAATLLERGRAAVRGGRERLMDATEGWE